MQKEPKARFLTSMNIVLYLQTYIFTCIFFFTVHPRSEYGPFKRGLARSCGRAAEQAVGRAARSSRSRNGYGSANVQGWESFLISRVVVAPFTHFAIEVLPINEVLTLDSGEDGGRTVGHCRGRRRRVSPQTHSLPLALHTASHSCCRAAPPCHGKSGRWRTDAGGAVKRRAFRLDKGAAGEGGRRAR